MFNKTGKSLAIGGGCEGIRVFRAHPQTGGDKVETALSRSHRQGITWSPSLLQSSSPLAFHIILNITSGLHYHPFLHIPNNGGTVPLIRM